jgi:protein-disulfide isomerase
MFRRIFFVNRRSIPALALIAALTIAGSFMHAAPQKAQKLKPTPAATPAPTPTVAILSVSGVSDIDSSRAYGSKTAPVLMEVFSDFQCPACKALNSSVNQKLMDEYVLTGKVYLVHRDFPLPMHAYSRVAASYARAAAHIGKGEAVEQALFKNQEVWEANGDVKGTVAGAVSPSDMKRVQALVDGKTLEPLIDKDKQIGLGVPVNQTPTTVFHSKGQTYPYSGNITYQVLKDFLDQLLSQK